MRQKKLTQEQQQEKETENRGRAVPLHVNGYPLKLDALLS